MTLAEATIIADIVTTWLSHDRAAFSGACNALSHEFDEFEWWYTSDEDGRRTLKVLNRNS